MHQYPSSSQIPEVTPRPTSFILSCPGCKSKRDTKFTRLYHPTNKPCILFCKQCHKSSPSRRWHCSCGEAWFTCGAHRADGSACRPQAKDHHVSGNEESVNKHSCTNLKRPRAVDPIRQLGNFTGADNFHVEISNRRLNLHTASSSSDVASIPLRGKRVAPISVAEPLSKRRLLAFTPGPILARSFCTLMWMQFSSHLSWPFATSCIVSRLVSHCLGFVFGSDGCDRHYERRFHTQQWLYGNSHCWPALLCINSVFVCS